MYNAGIDTAQSALRAALFDLDGTLLDTVADLAMAANALREHYQLPLLSEDQIAEFVGKGMENLVRRTLAGSRNIPAHLAQPQPEALAVFKSHYRRLNGERARLYQGVVDGLVALRDMGLQLGVVTNKPTEFTLPLLRQTGLAEFFEVVVCGDTCEHRKPHPMPVLHACEQLSVAPAEAVLVGDSMNDAQAGRAAGVRVLLVPYGYNEGRDVAELEADGVVADAREAAQWVSRYNTAGGFAGVD